MTDRAARRAWLRRHLAGGIAALLCLAGAALLALRPAVVDRWQERVFDEIVRHTPAPAPQGPPVLVIDIGAADEAGLPWDRKATARLAAALARGEPAVLAWDIVFAGACDDAGPNAALAAALSRAPGVLGFLLSSTPAPAPPAPPLALSEGAGARLWAAPGAEMPCPAFPAAGPTLAALSLPGDQTAQVRMVPAAVTVAGTAFPSLPVEALRNAGAVPMPVIAAETGGRLTLRLGAAAFPLDRAGMLRFRPQTRAARNARTVPAEAVLSGFLPAGRLRGAVVFVGSSLPQRGGLRPTSADPLYPSVQIAADLAQGLLSGRLPWRPANAPIVEATALAFGGLALALILARLAPLAAFAAACGLGLLWSGGALAAHAATGRLYDPAFPALILILSVLAGILARAAALSRAERTLRARIGQVLPAPVVARLIDAPGLLRLQGERRQITALFTDIEGFSALAAQLPPEALIATLDRYFATVTGAILRHGGMIDKIVGDGVHALFNAPLDQPGHVDAALAAAADVVAGTEALRPALGLGRTRIGIETGPAILGDVGSGAHIDYTAHGAAVNLAARLQEAGKELGPAVIIGPAAARAATRPLRALGRAEIRSFGPLDLFTL
jgi:adenylate cyclase